VVVDRTKGETDRAALSWSQTAQLIRAYHLHALGRHDAALAVYREIDWSSPTDQQGGLAIQAQAADLVRARCLQGELSWDRGYCLRGRGTLTRDDGKE
jgi:hypothetical protein